MAKLTLNDITSGYASVDTLNSNFTAIETALENTLSRDGTTPNSMSADLDMNGYAILNQRAITGETNFVWKGTWVVGGVYAKNNLVYAPEGSNVGNTLICVTAHTAGGTLDGDAAKWAVFAQRGAPGASGGDVQGPASSTADSLVRFNGTTGKVLKDGAVIGTDVQAYSAKLASYASNTLSAANKIPYASALNTAAELDFKDEDNMSSDSASAVPSQQSVKAYVDANKRNITVSYTGTSGIAFKGAAYTTTSSFPVDDTIPQISEGAALLDGSITIKANSKIRVSVYIPVNNSTASQNIVVAIFVDNTTNAYNAAIVNLPSSGLSDHIAFDDIISGLAAGTYTVKVRIGTSGGTLSVNGAAGTRLLGGALAATLILEEITA